MKNHGQYFFRGLLRLIAGGLVIGLAVLAFNVIGYHLIQHDLIIIGEPSKFPPSYVGRVLLLSIYGFFHLAVCAVAVLLGAVALFFAYYGVLYLGGYRETKDEAC
jgi:hypothetical protein